MEHSHVFSEVSREHGLGIDQLSVRYRIDGLGRDSTHSICGADVASAHIHPTEHHAGSDSHGLNGLYRSSINNGSKRDIGIDQGSTYLSVRV